MKAKKLLICLFSLCFLAFAPTLLRANILPAEALSSKVYVSAFATILAAVLLKKKKE